jgi:hypothetical protein
LSVFGCCRLHHGCRGKDRTHCGQPNGPFHKPSSSYMTVIGAG